MKLKAEIFGVDKYGRDWGKITLDVLAFYQTKESITVQMPCSDDIHGDFKIVVGFPKESFKLIFDK